MNRPQNGTLKVFGIAVGLAIVVFAGLLTWTRVDATQAATHAAQLKDHGRRIEKIEVSMKKIDSTYWLVRQLAGQAGIELPKE